MEEHEHKNKTVVTEEGMRKLEQQLEYYKSVRRNEVADMIAFARGFGDLSENAEYDEAKKEQAKLEEDIIKLENTIRTATVISDDEISTERVSVGTTVTLKDNETGEVVEYAIVGANESDPFNNKISNESPVGSALLGARKKQKVDVETPGGTITYTVISISR